MLSVLMKILSHASAKISQKGIRVLDFALLLVAFKQHHSSEGVKTSLEHLQER